MRDTYPTLYRFEDRTGRLVTLDVALLIGRILMAVIFIRAGFGKLMTLEATGAYIGTKLPAGAVLAPLVGIFELAAGLMLVVGFQTRTIALLLALFTLVANVLFHPYWTMTGQAAVANGINFYKNLAMIGGFLVLMAAGPGRYSVDRR